MIIEPKLVKLVLIQLRDNLVELLRLILKNKKLVNISWKADDSLWILTREMRKDEDPEIYEYHEDSTFGVIEGTVIIIEHKAGKKYSDK